ncbi:unnamed protein product [Rodentolepis nana]|uniref:Nephrin n=1 Tax=Rodentolepis nana TaxID=102285 RepID=A0A158QGH0_RODNA|nr:unnamed protein product [Rodentolepis nana]
MYTLICVVFYALVSVPDCRGLDGSEYFIQHPISQSVTLNSTFVLACRLKESLFHDTSSGKPVVQWILNKFGLGTTREDVHEAGMEPDSLISRYDLPYNLNEGQYDLQVRYAKSRDEGQYVCQLRYNGKTYFSQTVNVRVLVASEGPTLVQSDLSDASSVKLVGPQIAASVIEGSYLRLHCIAKNGKPGAKLSWTLNGSPLSINYNEDGTKGHIASPIEGNVSIKSVPAPEPPFLVTTISEILVYVTKLHHGSKIQCTAQNEGYENYPLQSAYTKLNVQYAPVVKMRLSPATGRRHLLENDVVTIRCLAEGRPDNFSWTWQVNDTIVENEKTDQYRIRLSRDLINATVTCIATTFADGSDSTFLTFQYAPQFPNQNPVIYAGALGEPLRMRCPVEGNPRPEVEWRLAAYSSSTPSANTAALIARGEVLERDKIHENDFGAYICVARAPGFPAISKKIILAKKSAPKIKAAEPVYAAIGAPARLPCTINAVPLPSPEGLLWFRRDIILQPTAHRKFSTQEFLGGVVHVMIFSHVLSTDFGFYNCSAVNAYGSDSQTLELRRDGNLYSNSINKHKMELGGESLGFMQSNSLPHTMDMNSKEDGFYVHSNSRSPGVDSFNRYQFPTITTRSSSALGNAHVRTPRSCNSPVSTDQCISMRSFSPICKYALIDGTGQHIPVCTNVMTFANDTGDFQLADDSGTATLCFSSGYQPIPINYVNVPVTDQLSSHERLCTMTPADIAPDSDIIANTQVTHV